MTIRRRLVSSAAAAAILSAVGVQLVPGPSRSNPPVTHQYTLQAASEPPEKVAALLRRACMDCHSNETRWPWYSRVAPLSWAIATDVHKARRAMNFSDWGKRTEGRPGKALGFFAAICADVQSGRMPLSNYLTLHPEAKLNNADRQAMCDWTRVESSRLLLRKQQPSLTQVMR